MIAAAETLTIWKVFRQNLVVSHAKLSLKRSNVTHIESSRLTLPDGGGSTGENLAQFRYTPPGSLAQSFFSHVKTHYCCFSLSSDDTARVALEKVSVICLVKFEHKLHDDPHHNCHRFPAAPVPPPPPKKEEIV